MKAMILAAGLGTRLKPWTLEHPKALVPVAGVPMLERVILRLKSQGFDFIVINVHHFASQIVDFIKSHDHGVSIYISDESSLLLDTGGGILHAESLLTEDNEPILVHNVDILSNADLSALMIKHKETSSIATLLVSERDSSRKLIFDHDWTLKAWHNIIENRFRPENATIRNSDRELAFSGIYTISTDVFDLMHRQGFDGKFPIMDFFLHNTSTGVIKGYEADNLNLIDIGKPETLSRANLEFSN